MKAGMAPGRRVRLRSHHRRRRCLHQTTARDVSRVARWIKFRLFSFIFPLSSSPLLFISLLLLCSWSFLLLFSIVVLLCLLFFYVFVLLCLLFFFLLLLLLSFSSVFFFIFFVLLFWGFGAHLTKAPVCLKRCFLVPVHKLVWWFNTGKVFLINGGNGNRFLNVMLLLFLLKVSRVLTKHEVSNFW